MPPKTGAKRKLSESKGKNEVKKRKMFSLDELEDANPEDFVMGIDEAGRGPVIGPMVYGCAFCRIADYKKLKEEFCVADSKQLTEGKRDAIAGKIRNCDFCEWTLNSIQPKTISEQMLRRDKYNLNRMSHDAAMGLIKKVVQVTHEADESTNKATLPPLPKLPDAPTEFQGFNGFKKPCKGKLIGVFVDTVGPPDKYQKKLEDNFPWLLFCVDKGADDKYPVVSAASIMAKTTRDFEVKNWKCDEPQLAVGKLGSGYPSDPATKAWLRKSFDTIFGFPTVVRFSWATTKDLLEKAAADVKFEDEVDDNLETLQKAFKPKVGQRLQLCSDLGLQLEFLQEP